MSQKTRKRLTAVLAILLALLILVPIVAGIFGAV